MYLVSATLIVALAPLWVPIAWLLDLKAGRSTLRCIAFFGVFVWTGLGGLAATGVAWLINGGPFGDRTRRYILRLYAIQRAWGLTLLKGGMGLFKLRLECDGVDEALADGGPLVVFSRHLSFVDTVLPFDIFGLRGFLPRYVMKKELLWDPCLDIVGGALPNTFVDRSGGNSEKAVAQVVELAQGLYPEDFVVLYPEGTRFTARRRARILEKIAARGDPEALARAEALTHVLPPRLGGTLGLLEATPETDVVFMGHTGLERITRLGNLVDGSLIGTTLRVTLWRVRHEDIPRGTEALVDWMYGHWNAMDDWVSQNEAPRARAA